MCGDVRGTEVANDDGRPPVAIPVDNAAVAIGAEPNRRDGYVRGDEEPGVALAGCTTHFVFVHSSVAVVLKGCTHVPIKVDVGCLNSIKARQDAERDILRLHEELVDVVGGYQMHGRARHCRGVVVEDVGEV